MLADKPTRENSNTTLVNVKFDMEKNGNVHYKKIQIQHLLMLN